MKKEIAQLSKENSRLANENKKLSEALDTSQKESSALSTKLSAARSSAQSETKAVPGSAMKARAGGIILPGTAEATREAQLQKQKVEMYCDLTNLVIVGVKKNEDEEDVYDCLQTGRNGSKLALRLRLLLKC
jgi:predicted RNase H-like nuclease (RuvC/YqgF family)